MTEQERRAAELRKMEEAATQAKANGDPWMAVHPDTLTVLVAEIAALKEKVKRQAGILEWQRIDVLLLLGAVMAMKPNSELERRCDDILRRAAQEASE